MARLREQPAPPGAPPARFVYEDWSDEAADGPMPAYWDPKDTWMWHKIRAFKRYLLAKHGLRELPTGEVTHFSPR